ncbi:hypothetical protein HY640_00250 [Candidatus Woesearchaeota archaeon]|nr:hypothetical protein [Candidatus Woesearchaeota archaeon]
MRFIQVNGSILDRQEHAEHASSAISCVMDEIKNSAERYGFTLQKETASPYRKRAILNNKQLAIEIRIVIKTKHRCIQ